MDELAPHELQIYTFRTHIDDGLREDGLYMLRLGRREPSLLGVRRVGKEVSEESGREGN